MTAIVAGLYIVQTAAIVYLLMVSFDILRKFTLSKNVQWVQENPAFARQNARSPRWPVIGCGITVSAVFLFFAIAGSYTELFVSRAIALCGIALIPWLIYLLIERTLREKIPQSSERSASLLPKSIESYISKNLARTSYAAILILALAYAISFFAGKIGFATFAGDIAYQVLVNSICLATIWYVIKEKVPHKNALGSNAQVDIGKLYKVINIKLSSLAIIFYSLICLAELVMQWYGHELPNPLAAGWYRLFNETHPPVPIVGQPVWDIIFTALSIPLFIYLANNKFFKEIRAVNLLADTKGKPVAS